MGTAREVADRISETILAGDFETLKGHYAPRAVLVDPLAGEVSGGGIVGVYRDFMEAFSEFGYEQIGQHESGNVAIDEGTSWASTQSLFRCLPARRFPLPAGASGCGAAMS